MLSYKKSPAIRQEIFYLKTILFDVFLGQQVNHSNCIQPIFRSTFTVSKRTNPMKEVDV